MAELAIRGVAKSFGAVRALVDADLTVAPGSLTAVLGPARPLRKVTRNHDQVGRDHLRRQQERLD